jgi:hypothetical protein
MQFPLGKPSSLVHFPSEMVIWTHEFSI